jgi:hypothetical protein
MQYISKHNRSYSSLAEYEFRKALYTNTDAVIKEHNASQSSYLLAHNKFSDRSEAEMAQSYGENKMASDKEPVVLPVASSFAAIDWISAGCVNPI